MDDKPELWLDRPSGEDAHAALDIRVDVTGRFQQNRDRTLADRSIDDNAEAPVWSCRTINMTVCAKRGSLIVGAAISSWPAREPGSEGSGAAAPTSIATTSSAAAAKVEPSAL